jgi:CRISPR system Cascade subunit CasA
MTAPEPTRALMYSLLDEPLIRYRRVGDGAAVQASLPQLFVAMAADVVRDFPALRPHQRHPWHAFLVQLAAIALHHAGQSEPWATVEEWRAALLALTPNDPDGAAWCLVSPPDRPALLQAPVLGGRVDDWKVVQTPDRLDMLVTSKNHDLKVGRMDRCSADDWLFALVSLQTQEGWGGSTNYGISRMYSNYGSRSSVTASPAGHLGGRWKRDVRVLAESKAKTAEDRGLKEAGGLALLWLVAWDGSISTQLAFSTLDAHYIEICRRIRFLDAGSHIQCVRDGSSAGRVNGGALKGVTGDPWAPIDREKGAVLTISHKGFDYELLSDIFFGSKFESPPTLTLTAQDASSSPFLLAQGVTRGQSKTEGYHERRVPISPKVRTLLMAQQKTSLAQNAKERIAGIAAMGQLLKAALVTLFSNGTQGKKPSDSAKEKASRFLNPFEQTEDARFFIDLNDEVEAADPAAQRLAWMLGLVDRADAILRAAFTAGPRSGIQRYRAQAAALSRFHGSLRGEKSPLPVLANHYHQQAQQHQEDQDERTQSA